MNIKMMEKRRIIVDDVDVFADFSGGVVSETIDKKEKYSIIADITGGYVGLGNDKHGASPKKGRTISVVWK